MNILYAVLILTVLGGVFGLVLSIASKVFEVKSDPRLAEILDSLPGANCGGCGYAGCAGCAAAILEGKAPVNACPSNTGEKTARIAAIMGVEVKPVERRVAFVRCAGGDRAGHKFDKYVGLTDCVAAMKVAGDGPLDCTFGCLGLGSCVKACKFDAIHINSRGVAEVDREKCGVLHAVRRRVPEEGHRQHALQRGHRAALRQQGEGRPGQGPLRHQLHRLQAVRAQLPLRGHHRVQERGGHRLRQVHLLRDLRGEVSPEAHRQHPRYRQGCPRGGGLSVFLCQTK